MDGKKFSLIVDESPDLMGRPTVNILAAYFDEKDQDKKVLLLDVSYVSKANSASIMNVISSTLSKYDRTFDDVLAIASDSAQYMVKLVGDIMQSINRKLYHIKDIAHLIHIAVDKATNIQEMQDLRNIIIKTGAMFQHSAKQLDEFYKVVQENGGEAIKPIKVVEHRWFSLLSAAKVIKTIWPYLVEFYTSEETKSKKSEAIRMIPIDKDNQSLIYF